jgi:NADH:ubiquinone oxidoreductase subunit 4 (subunit M)
MALKANPAATGVLVAGIVLAPAALVASVAPVSVDQVSVDQVSVDQVSVDQVSVAGCLLAALVVLGDNPSVRGLKVPPLSVHVALISKSGSIH